MKLSVLSVLCVVGLVNSASGFTRDTLARFDPSSASVFYQDPGIRAQAARFDLGAPAYVRSVTLWLAGRTTGEITFRIYGNEGSFSAPLLNQPLSPVITARKNRPNVQKVEVLLPGEVFVDRPQFFVVIEGMDEGIRLLSDREEKQPICADAGERWTCQSILGSDGIWRVGKYGYAVEVVVEYPEAYAPGGLEDVTSEVLDTRGTGGTRGTRGTRGAGDRRESPSVSPAPVLNAPGRTRLRLRSTSPSREKGIAWGDVDRNGWVDLLAEGRLWLNRGGEDGFEEITERLGLGDEETFTSGHFLDVDNDRDLDVLLLGFADGSSRLLLNDGRGNFEERGPPLPELWNPISLSIADADGDHALDLYVVQGKDTAEAELPDYIFSLEGDVPRSGTEGVRPLPLSEANIIAAQWLDYDADGDIDLYLTGQTSTDSRLLLNDGRGGLQPAELTTPTSPSTSMGGDATYSMNSTNSPHSMNSLANSDWSDNNGDGRPDLLQPINPASVDALRGADFSDPYLATSNLATSFSGSGTWSDVDNDGRLDVLVTSSCDCRFATLYRQERDGSFTESSFEYGLFRVPAGSDAVWVDWNNDGKLDLSTFVGGELKLYKNTGHTGHNYIAIDLEGSNAPSEVAGSVVHLYAGDGYQSRPIVTGRGALMQGPLRVHFGLENEEKVDSVVVAFANGGERRVLLTPEINRLHRLFERGEIEGRKDGVTAFTVSPNPFRSLLRFEYDLQEKRHVRIELRSIDGSLVGVAIDEEQGSGHHRIEWKATDGGGSPLPAGTYIWRAELGPQTLTGRAVLVH